MSDWKKMSLIVLVGALVCGLGWFMGKDLSAAKEAQRLNPFTKIGHIATANGLLVEVYKMKYDNEVCVIAVQMVPQEIGRAAVQMECR